MCSKEETDRLAKYAALLSYVKKEQIPNDVLAQEWGTSGQVVRGMVGVLARGGKILNDLAGMGY